VPGSARHARPLEFGSLDHSSAIAVERDARNPRPTLAEFSIDKAFPAL